MGEVMLQNDKKIMWLGVDIYEALLKFKQVKEVQNQVSLTIEKRFKRTTSTRFGWKNDQAQKPLRERGRDDINSNYSNDA